MRQHGISHENIKIFLDNEIKIAYKNIGEEYPFNDDGSLKMQK